MALLSFPGCVGELCNPLPGQESCLFRLHLLLSIAVLVPEDLSLRLMEGQERIQHQNPNLIFILPDCIANARLSSAGEVAQTCDVEQCSKSAAVVGVELFHF